MDALITLNKGQEDAVKAFLGFLLSDEKEMLITGSPGTGKSFLMKYMKKFAREHYVNACKLIDKEPEYFQFIYTATTNKAAEVLEEFLGEETSTIHSLLGLAVFENYETGTNTLRKVKDNLINHSIVFIDECSMINKELYDAIHKYTHDCKIVYVGDKYQLAPVKESISPVFTNIKTIVELTEPVRNRNYKELRDACEAFKLAVQTGKFPSIKADGSVIEYLDKDQIEQRVKEDFNEFSVNKRILCYSNKNVIGYNRYIQKCKNIPEFIEGGTYICASAFNDFKFKASVESKITIISMEPETDMPIFNIGSIKLIKAIVKNQFGIKGRVYITREYDKFIKILKSLANAKHWKEYYQCKDSILDIRPYEASTVHKAQGSTLDTVYIDLTDISRCTQPNMAARLLYVSFSRAKEKVILFGRLKDAYGKIICSGNNGQSS